MPVAIDPLISGIVDDGNEAGIMRTRLSTSGMVLRPFERGRYTALKNGTATSEFREEGDFLTLGWPCYFVQLSNGVVNGVELRFKFPGRRLGLAFVRNVTTTDSFTAVVDGEAYKVDVTVAAQVDPAVGGPSHLAQILVADNLPEAMDHECRLFFQGNATTSPSFYIVGWLEEERFGFVTPPRLPRALEPVALTTAAAALPHDNGGATLHAGFRYFRNVSYYNVPQAITSITSSSTTATVTTTAVHNLVSGQQVTIAGSLNPEYNGTYTVTVTTTTAFTYTFAGSATSPATGTKTFGATGTVIIARNSVDLWSKTLLSGDSVVFDPGGNTSYNEVVSESIGGGYNYKHRLLLVGPVINATVIGGW